MNNVIKIHIRRLPFYVFAIGIVIVLFYFGSIAIEESLGRTLVVFAMLPFYVGCVVLLSLLVWIVARLFM